MNTYSPGNVVSVKPAQPVGVTTSSATLRLNPSNRQENHSRPQTSIEPMSRSMNVYPRSVNLIDTNRFGNNLVHAAQNQNPTSSMNVQLGSREFSPSPMQKTFKNNLGLTSPGTSFQPNPNPMATQQQVYAGGQNPMLGSLSSLKNYGSPQNPPQSTNQMGSQQSLSFIQQSSFNNFPGSRQGQPQVGSSLSLGNSMGGVAQGGHNFANQQTDQRNQMHLSGSHISGFAGQDPHLQQMASSGAPNQFTSSYNHPGQSIQNQGASYLGQTASISGAYPPEPSEIAGNLPEQRSALIAKEKERMKILGTHKQMMETMLDEKFKEFRTVINKNLKEKFDNELKRALFHLWRHYRNCNEKNMTPEEIQKSTHDSLRKMLIETNELKDKNSQMNDVVRQKEFETTEFINRHIKEINQNNPSQNRYQDPNMQGDRRRYFLESNINSMNGECKDLERKLKEHNDGRPTRLYEERVGLEVVGRELMDEYSRGVTIEQCPTDDPSLVDLRNRVAMYRNDYLSTKEQWTEGGYGTNPHEAKIRKLEQELFDLEKKYEALKKSN